MSKRNEEVAAEAALATASRVGNVPNPGLRGAGGGRRRGGGVSVGAATAVIRNPSPAITGVNWV